MPIGRRKGRGAPQIVIALTRQEYDQLWRDPAARRPFVGGCWGSASAVPSCSPQASAQASRSTGCSASPRSYRACDSARSCFTMIRSTNGVPASRCPTWSDPRPLSQERRTGTTSLGRVSRENGDRVSRADAGVEAVVPVAKPTGDHAGDGREAGGSDGRLREGLRPAGLSSHKQPRGPLDEPTASSPLRGPRPARQSSQFRTSPARLDVTPERPPLRPPQRLETRLPLPRRPPQCPLGSPPLAP